MTSINMAVDGTAATLAGRSAIITGGSSGIGYSTAEILSREGCNVVIADLQPPVGEPQLSGKAGRIQYYRCDITDWTSLTALFAFTLSAHGRIDVVHANVGVNEIGDPFLSSLATSTGELKEPNLKTIDVNVKGTINTVALGMHYMRNNPDGGNIIITASLAGYFGTNGMPIYTASKHALVGLVRALARPAVDDGIAISLVAPGMTETPLLAALPGKDQSSTSKEELEVLWAELRSSGIPSQSPDIVAQAVCYLARCGRKAGGVGLFVQGSEVIDIERELITARPEWLSRKMTYLVGTEKPVWE